MTAPTKTVAPQAHPTSVEAPALLDEARPATVRAQREQELPASADRVRRWSDADEKHMVYGLLGFLLLGLYAAAGVAWGMWLTA
ncbi:MAG TPA: hypothetical protein VNU66_13235 [Mycobacteriales bacterium]|nr:hypothetical protein [Mycobacteriales bacterium]